MSVSRCEKVVAPVSKIEVIDCDHAVNLCRGNRTQNERVSMSQPKVFLISCKRPSAKSFRIDNKSLREMGSFGSNGHPIIWIAKGTAAEALGSFVGECKEIVTVSSMYTSALPTGSRGTVTIICLAEPNGTELPRRSGVVM